MRGVSDMNVSEANIEVIAIPLADIEPNPGYSAELGDLTPR
ncbi:hypothetical protein [Streptomyces spongiicola]|nr:hypothetical protein [Streptomyces spongiicola]